MTAASASFDYESIVDDAAGRFERDFPIRVGRDARDVLVARARQNDAAVQREKDVREVSFETLTDGAYDQLSVSAQVLAHIEQTQRPPGEIDDAFDIGSWLRNRAAANPPVITGDVVIFGIRLRCRYVPWC